MHTKKRNHKGLTVWWGGQRLRSAFCEYFWVFLTLDYDYTCSETDFTQEKSHFHPTTRIPNSSLLFAAALSQNGRIAV